MSEQKEYQKVLVVCTGAFISTKGQLVFKFRHIDENYNFTDKEELSWKGVTGFPGTIYSVETESLEAFKERGQIYTKSFNWVDKWKNETESLAWQADAKAASIRLAAEKRKGQEREKFDELRRLLKPIREMYQQTNALGKAAIITLVVREIQRDPTFED